jgi:hypothetical protein
MTTPRRWQTGLRKPRVPAVVVAFAVGLLATCAVSLLAGCAGAAAQVDLPAKPAAGPAARLTAPAPATSRQQVVAALTAYTAALSRAEQSRNASDARRLLRPYLATNRIGGLVKAVSGIWASGEIFYGTDELHVLTVRIDGPRAFVHDCDDTAGLGLENAATGQSVPGSAGVADANLVTRLDQVAGHWVVESQLPEDLPCAP